MPAQDVAEDLKPSLAPLNLHCFIKKTRLKGGYLLTELFLQHNISSYIFIDGIPAYSRDYIAMTFAIFMGFWWPIVSGYKALD